MIRMASAHVADARWTALKNQIIARSGHHYYADKDLVLAERVERRMAARGCPTLNDYIDVLAAPDAPEWDALFAEITIGETFFFRFAEQFAALRSAILPRLIARCADTKRLRIWSAGCASGAETYSLAILVQSLLGAEWSDWHVSILGTDLNEAALVKARSGAFSPWALRTLGPTERDLYFDSVANGRSFLLKRPYRASVRFRAHNLLDLLDGETALDLTDFDLVLCRNVLIYFQSEIVTRIIGALGTRLVEDGWLILGHAEAGFGDMPGLAQIEIAGMTAYQPAHTPVPVLLVPPIEMRPAVLPDIAPPAKPILDIRAVPPIAAPSPPALPPMSDLETALADLRKLADAGAYGEALDLCTRIESNHPLDPRGHYYEGLVHRSCGRTRDAQDALDRALYLDGSFLMAHYQKGLALLDAGKRAQARRSLALTVQLADRYTPDATIAEGEGLSAAALSSYARVVLERSAD